MCKEFLKLFTLCLIVFLTLFIVIDFFQKIDNFVEAKVSYEFAFSFFLYRIPYIILQMMPVATLISVIMLYSFMKRDREILALKASGINVFKISQIIFALSVLISLTAFIFSELVVPYTSSKSNEIWDIEVKKHDPASFYGDGDIWYKSPTSIYWIKHFDVLNRVMEKPTFYFFDTDFSLVKRIDGKRSVWESDIWKIEDGIVQERNEIGEYEVNTFESLYLDIPETPDTFIKMEKDPEDMSFIQLKRFSEKVFAEGYDNTKYVVDMNIKLAFPMVSFIMTLLGIPLVLGQKSWNTPLYVSIGIGLCFLYMVFISISRSLGLSGILPPLLSAWSANLIFILFGIFLILNLER